MLPLIEPLGLLHGPAAAEAVAAGQAAWLAGGPAAFALGRVIGKPDILPVRDLPAEALARIAGAPPPWAGLPGGRALVMGVLNVTPDSFSDGGVHAATDRAIAAGVAMAAAGADLIDVGAESTRPGAAATPPEIERARLLPVVRALAAEGLVLSADTRNAATMAAALDAGARIVNDVSGLAYDPQARATVAARRCPVVLMHMRGLPATMQSLAQYRDVAAEVTGELAVSLAVAEAAGIDRTRVALDPGIGFAKGPGHNEELLARLPVLLNLGCRLVVGVSRKGFIGRITNEAVARQRLGGSLAAGLAAVLGGAAILRVHDVAETAQAVRVWHAIFHGAAAQGAAMSAP
jgi:dihydropteroate synthase